jgi:glutamine cyclotransferase
MLYESTGLYGRSTLQQIDATTGIVQQSIAVPQVFAEGLVRWENRLIQLTWQEQKAFIYNLTDFSKIGQFEYDTEGWGLTADQQSLIMSDGTDVLYFRDPLSFDILRTVRVTLNNEPLNRINELEYIQGLVYANVWGEDIIVQIDPNSGQVRGIVDARALRQMQPSIGLGDVLNGIAYHPERRTLYLTGKNWPALFEVELVQRF